MKKKIIILVSIFILMIIIVSTIVYSNKNNYITKNPFEDGDGKLIGIIQIGGSALDYNYTIVDKYFKTREFETIEFGGEEKYLIIPREDEINVYSLILTEDGGIEEVFIKTMSKPFYITCNVSDIISNSMLRIIKDSKQYSYSPYISLKDGSLVVEEFVLHIQ